MRACPDCRSSKKGIRVHQWDNSLEMPDPLSFCDRLELLLVSWSPPGGMKARRDRHFFYNPRSKDLLRPKLFTAFKQAGFQGLREATPEIALNHFQRYGMYLTPSVFRRCSSNGKDHGPPDDLLTHSILEHVLSITEYSRPRVVFLLGVAPVRGMLSAFPNKFHKLRKAYDTFGSVRACRRVLMNSPEVFIHSSGYTRMFVSYWPRGKGIEYLAEDIRLLIPARKLE